MVVLYHYRSSIEVNSGRLWWVISTVIFFQLRSGVQKPPQKPSSKLGSLVLDFEKRNLLLCGWFSFHLCWYWKDFKLIGFSRHCILGIFIQFFMFSPGSLSRCGIRHSRSVVAYNRNTYFSPLQIGYFALIRKWYTKKTRSVQDTDIIFSGPPVFPIKEAFLMSPLPWHFATSSYLKIKEFVYWLQDIGCGEY